MKAFLIKCAAFALIAAVCIGVCNYGYLRTDPYGTDKYKDMPEKLDICNIGASHSKYSFDYEPYADRYDTFNFAFDSQSHEYDYLILQCYQDRIKEGGFVFIVVSYPMLCGRSETESDEFEAKNVRYYSFLPKEYIREFDWTVRLRTKLIPFVDAITARSVLKGILHIQETEDVQVRTTDPDYAKMDAEKAFVRHTVTGRFDENGQRIYNQDAIDAIYGMIDLCREKGATPVLITTPFTVEYSTKIKEGAPDLYEWFYETIGKIQQDTGVEYYNYSEDERFTTGDYYRLFMNSDHLNKDGARLFTQIVMEEIIRDRLQ